MVSTFCNMCKVSFQESEEKAALTMISPDQSTTKHISLCSKCYKYLDILITISSNGED